MLLMQWFSLSIWNLKGFLVRSPSTTGFGGVAISRQEGLPMTTYTLMTGFVLVLGVASWCATVVLSVLLIWTGRRIGNVEDCRRELHTLSTTVKNVNDQVEHFRKRDAVRQSRRRKEVIEEESQPAEDEPLTSEDIVARFERRS